MIGNMFYYYVKKIFAVSQNNLCTFNTAQIIRQANAFERGWTKK